jgi:hypothetical protein
MCKDVIAIMTLFILLFQINPASGQEKYEKESRIKAREAPARAIDFIDSLDIDARIKWYSEEGLDGKSVEAKYRKNKQKYSVEFDTLGNIQDVEIKVKWANLDAHLKDIITEQLGKDCDKHKIRKVQIQYSGDRDEILAKTKGKDKATDITTRYEIIVRCRADWNVNLYEYLFSDAGQILTTSKIIFKNSSHLEY